MSATLSGQTTKTVLERAMAALCSLYVGDALAMPVHWFYNPKDILDAFPGGVQKLEDAPAYHPSSIMTLHSTAHGGRGAQSSGREIVGEVILKGKRPFWGQPNQHYHQGMKAGENTLNAHCARLVTRGLIAGGGRYDRDRFLDDYIRFMTADTPLHPDTYAESYHRGFFANLENGMPRDRCGAVTHDTPSVGGLVTLAPIVFAERLSGRTLADVQTVCAEHLSLTHPDATLTKVADAYVGLLDALLFREDEDPRDFLAIAARDSLGLDLSRLAAWARSDSEVVGGQYSTACYITDSWPSLLYLTYKYVDNPRAALLANTNLGGDSVHRGAVMGVILGLAHGCTVDAFFTGLKDREAIEAEINVLLEQPT